MNTVQTVFAILAVASVFISVIHNITVLIMAHSKNIEEFEDDVNFSHKGIHHHSKFKKNNPEQDS